MRSHVEFRSSALLDAQGDETGPKGEAVARLLAAGLPGHRYQIERVDPEDWGWRVQIANSAFPLWIGCGHIRNMPTAISVSSNRPGPTSGAG